jgi:hypothetical protein
LNWLCLSLDGLCHRLSLRRLNFLDVICLNIWSLLSQSIGRKSTVRSWGRLIRITIEWIFITLVIWFHFLSSLYSFYHGWHICWTFYLSLIDSCWRLIFLCHFSQWLLSKSFRILNCLSGNWLLILLKILSFRNLFQCFWWNLNLLSYRSIFWFDTYRCRNSCGNVCWLEFASRCRRCIIGCTFRRRRKIIIWVWTNFF